MNRLFSFIVIVIIASVLRAEEREERRVFVPLKDIGSLIGPKSQTVLMERSEFETLLKKAAATTRSKGFAAVTIDHADYRVGQLADDGMTVDGALTLSSLADAPIAIPIPFSDLSITSALLDGKPAPMNLVNGRLVLIITGKGNHVLTFSADLTVNEMDSGGRQFSASFPPAVKGSMTLRLTGNQEIHSIAPVSSRSFDAKTNVTEAKLVVGGMATVSVAMTGNGAIGRDDSMLMADAATTVQLNRGGSDVDCLMTVHTLKHGSNVQTFRLPTSWTVTDVSSPALVKWSISPGNRFNVLTVKLQDGRKGIREILVQAVAPPVVLTDNKGTWDGGNCELIGADVQHGYLLVIPGTHVIARAETLKRCRRQNAGAAEIVRGLIGTSGRLYYHWGSGFESNSPWSISLELAAVAAKIECQSQQTAMITKDTTMVIAHHVIVPLGRPAHEVSFNIPKPDARWDLVSALVNKKRGGFDLRRESSPAGSILRVDLNDPVPVDQECSVALTFRYHEPATTEKGRTIAIPLITCRSELVEGVAAVTSDVNFETTSTCAVSGVERVPTGKMERVGLGPEVRSAFSYKSAVSGVIHTTITPTGTRFSAKTLGVLSVRADALNAQFFMNVTVSGRPMPTFLVAIDSRIGDRFEMNLKSHRLRSLECVKQLDADSGAPSLWRVELDEPTLTTVRGTVTFSMPHKSQKTTVPVIRVLGAETESNLVVFESAAELAVAVEATGARTIDRMALPPLPGKLERILGAYEYVGDSDAAFSVHVTPHDRFGLPAAMVTRMVLTTFLGKTGAQQTRATFILKNRGLQFLTFRFDTPKTTLLSAEVDGKQMKPQVSDRGDYELPVISGDTSQKIVLFYLVPGSSRGRATLQAPILAGLTIDHTSWTVTPPKGLRIDDAKTDMSHTSLFVDRTITGILLPHLVEYHRLTDMLAGEPLPHPLLIPFTNPRAKLIERLGGPADENVTLDMPAPPAMPKAADDAPDTSIRGLPDFGGGTEDDMWSCEAITQTVAVRVKESGRYTLPTDPVGKTNAGTVTFTGLGAPQVSLSLRSERLRFPVFGLGFLCAVVLGLLIGKFRPDRLAVTLGAAVLIGIFLLRLDVVLQDFAKGLTYGAITTAVLAVLRRMPLLRAKPIATAALVFLVGMNAFAGGGKRSIQKSGGSAPKKPTIVTPYDGTAVDATSSTKVLISRKRFVELWNAANPDERMPVADTSTELAFSAARYDLRVVKTRIHLTLTVQVETRVALDLPLSFHGVAITGVRLDEKAITPQASPFGLIVSLPKGFKGTLSVSGRMTPVRTGRRGVVSFTMPKLPMAVAHVYGLTNDLELSASADFGGFNESTATSLTCRKSKDVWHVPFGSSDNLTLAWSPRAGKGEADKTMTATAGHRVKLRHWGMTGKSTWVFTYPAGSRNTFDLALPADAIVADVTGTDVRDYRVGKAAAGYRTVRVSLFRDVSKTFKVTVKWVRRLTHVTSLANLPLPSARGVGRESGVLELHRSGDLSVKVTSVTGGRRVNRGQSQPKLAGETTLVAKYVWPYSGFAMVLAVDRSRVRRTSVLRQLIRALPEDSQLIVQADESAEDGRLFGVSYSVPTGYDVLTVAGRAVEDWHVLKMNAGTSLHVDLRSAPKRTTLAVVMVKNSPPNAQFVVPMLTATTAAGERLSTQTGKLAIQLPASFAAQTASATGVHSIAPLDLVDWLKDRAKTVRFAYVYGPTPPTVTLGLRRKAARKDVEILAGVGIERHLVRYTYRLRFAIEGSPVDQLSFSLPEEYSKRISIDSPLLRSSGNEIVDGRAVWTVKLLRYVTGAIDVTLNWTDAIDGKTTHLAVPEVVIPNVGQYHAIIAIQNSSNHELDLETTMMALPHDDRKTSIGLVTALQYAVHTYKTKWTATLTLTPEKAAKRIPAVIDLMSITTMVDKEGNTRNKVVLSVDNRTRQFLPVELPKSLQLWSARVADASVRPVVSPDRPAVVLIPLTKTSDGGEPYEVVLLLGSKTPMDLGALSRIKPPRLRILDVPVKRSTWTLLLPKDYVFTRPGGNMSLIAGKAEIMNINVEAKISQAGRILKGLSDIGSGSSYKSQKMAIGNLKQMGTELEKEIADNERYVTSNRSGMNDADYSRVVGQIERQKGSLAGLKQSLADVADEKQVGQGVNFAINTAATNMGTDDGNALLTDNPDFVKSLEKAQKDAIDKEVGRANSRSAIRLRDTSGQTARKLDAVTRELARKKDVGTKRLREILMRKAQGSVFNRSQRYFSKKSGQQKNAYPEHRQWKRSREAYESILLRDPANEEAIAGLENIYIRLREAAQKRRRASEAERMAEVEWKWIDATPPTEEQVDDSNAAPDLNETEFQTADGIGSGQGRQTGDPADALRKKLEEIIITKISFVDTRVSVVFEFLKNQSRNLDTEGEGVNFLVILKANTFGSAAPAADDIGEGLEELGGDDLGLGLEEPLGLEGDDLEQDGDDQVLEGPNASDEPFTISVDEQSEPTITMDFDNIPLGQAIRYVCEQANLKYKIEEHSVVILGPSVERGQLELRFFPVTRSFANPARFGGTGDRVDFKRLFENMGVSFNIMADGTQASIAYDRGTSQLVVRNFHDQLRLVEKILQRLGAYDNVPRQSDAGRTPRRPRMPKPDKAARMRKKLEEIIIPKIPFDGTRVSTIFEFLKNQSRNNDPDGEGVNFLLILKPNYPYSPDTLEEVMTDIENDEQLVEEGDDLGLGDLEDNDELSLDDLGELDEQQEPTITMDFDNIPLGQAIRYICEQANLTYRVEEYAVVILGPNVERGQLELRFFPIDPDMFSFSGDEDDSGPVDFKRKFEDMGVAFNMMADGSQASIYFDEGTSQLVVRNTHDQLRLIERILSRVNCSKSDDTKDTAIGAIGSTTTDAIVMATSTAVTSMDLDLPEENMVRLDFAYPGGEPEVSVLAVPEVWVSGGKRLIRFFLLAIAIAAFLLLWRMLKKRMAYPFMKSDEV